MLLRDYTILIKNQYSFKNADTQKRQIINSVTEKNVPVLDFTVVAGALKCLHTVPTGRKLNYSRQPQRRVILLQSEMLSTLLTVTPHTYVNNMPQTLHIRIKHANLCIYGKKT